MLHDTCLNYQYIFSQKAHSLEWNAFYELLLSIECSNTTAETAIILILSYFGYRMAMNKIDVKKNLISIKFGNPFCIEWIQKKKESKYRKTHSVLNEYRRKKKKRKKKKERKRKRKKKFNFSLLVKTEGEEAEGNKKKNKTRGERERRDGGQGD